MGVGGRAHASQVGHGKRGRSPTGGWALHPLPVHLPLVEPMHADPSPGLGSMPHRLAARTAPSESPRSKGKESQTGSAHPSRGLSGAEDLGISSLASGNRKRLGLAARGALWVLWFASVVQTFQTAWRPAGPTGGAAAWRGEAGVLQLRPRGSVLLFLIPARPRSLSLAFEDLHFVPYLRLSSV